MDAPTRRQATHERYAATPEGCVAARDGCAATRPSRVAAQATRSAACVRTAIVVAALSTSALAGCSLFTMAGKMFFGDPVLTCSFKQVTRIDLVDSKKPVLVLCTVPESVNSRYPAINQRILEAVTRKLKREGIAVVNANHVLTWLDDRNGVWGSPDELAEGFDASYIIHIDLTEFTHRAENSPGMYQGKTMGEVHAYKVVKQGDVKHARPIFSDAYRSDYPPNNPISRSQASGKIFLENYIARISTELAWTFYDHPAGDGVF